MTKEEKLQCSAFRSWDIIRIFMDFKLILYQSGIDQIYCNNIKTVSFLSYVKF